MKKLTALVLTVLLVAVLVVPALAADKPDTDLPRTAPTPTGSLPVPGSTATETDPSGDTVELSAEMQTMLNLVNQARKDAGLPPLEATAATQSAAATRARECATYYSHSRPDGTKGYSILYDMGFAQTARVGENIARGHSSSTEVMGAWLKSAGHSANILNEDYKYIGIASHTAAGTTYWVQLFAG